MRIFTATRSPTNPAIDDSEGGFTLVELMVVIFIIGLASAAVVMTARAPDRGARDEAEQLAARIAALRDHAVLQSRTMAIWVSPSGYGFDSRAKGSWQPLSQAPFSTTDWRRGTSIRLAGATQLRVAFDSTGLPSTPARIALERGGDLVSVELAATGDVRVAKP